MEGTPAAASVAMMSRRLGAELQLWAGARASFLSNDDGCVEHVMILLGIAVTPHGLKLSVSMRITTRGHMVGKTFAASAIHAHYGYTGEHLPVAATCR